jgi:hypothetical protein
MKKDIFTFVEECDVFQRNKGETIKPPAHSNRFRFHPLVGGTSLWILLWDYLNQEIIISSWWLWIVFPSILIYVLFNTHLPHQRWLNFSWIISSSFMACLILLFLIEIQLSPEIFGTNSSDSKAPNCILAPPIIPIVMVKRKSSISVWRLI